jgi:uncharacterized protein YecT (DUF1311 family)
MGSLKLPALVLLAAMFAGASAAQPPEREPDCNDALAQQDMNRCAYLDFEKADKELNRIYAKVVAQAKSMDRDMDTGTDRPLGAEDALRRAQRAWITYRDAHCEAMSAHSRGGSMEPMLISGCKASLTEDRTKELGDLLSELGG